MSTGKVENELSEPVSSRETSFRLAEYNLHGETSGWGPNRFTPVDPVAELERLDADVYVLPETWAPHSPDEPQSRVLAWAEDTGRSIHLARSSESTPRRVHNFHGDSYVSIVTSLPVLEVRDHTLPVHPKDNSEDRNVVATLLDTGANGKVWVAGVHMSARVPHVPAHNLWHLSAFVDQLERTGYPVVVAGDFNLWGWWVRAIHRRRYRRAVRGRTWPASRPHSQIDHILIPGNVVADRGLVAAAGFSDHRAIYADLKVKDPAAAHTSSLSAH